MITTAVSLNQVTVRALIIILIIKGHYHLTRHKKLSETILGSKKSYEAMLKKNSNHLMYSVHVFLSLWKTNHLGALNCCSLVPFPLPIISFNIQNFITYSIFIEMCWVCMTLGCIKDCSRSKRSQMPQGQGWSTSTNLKRDKTQCSEMRIKRITVKIKNMTVLGNIWRML